MPRVDLADVDRAIAKLERKATKRLAGGGYARMWVSDIRKLEREVFAPLRALRTRRKRVVAARERAAERKAARG